MPWKRMSVDEQRIQFVVRAASGTEPLAALCRGFGISRPTGYLWRAHRARWERARGALHAKTSKRSAST